jgi:SAM-dependent methyltransferase
VRLVRRLRRPARVLLARRLLRLLDQPVSAHYGFDRGTPVDRRYIEGFLTAHAADVRGRVLEVKDTTYAERFGAGRITTLDVVDIDRDNPRATVVADLDDPAALPAAAYDCVVLTQVLQYLDPEAALSGLYRALAPGGVLLLTVPCLCRLEFPDGDLWRWSGAGLWVLLERVLPDAELSVESFGTLAGAVAFTMGVAAEEVDAGQLQPPDWRFPVMAGARVQRPPTPPDAR